MKVNIQLKRGLWDEPHYYLCWNNTENRKSFFVCTSNGFGLFASGLCNPSQMLLVNQYQSRIFSKPTYLLCGESFRIKNIKEPSKFKKVENALPENDFNRVAKMGATANQIEIMEDKYILI